VTLETLGILLALFIGLLVAVFCFSLVWEAAKWALWWVLRGISRCMPVAWRVAVVRRVPWLWDKAWRAQYLARHAGQ
jgi:hypothetical protein